jgi:hypothetical protein
MREKISLKFRKEKKDKGKKQWKYDATFDDILDLVVSADKKTKKTYWPLGLRLH